MERILPILAFVALRVTPNDMSVAYTMSVVYTEINMEYLWDDPISRKPKYSEKCCRTAKFTPQISHVLAQDQTRAFRLEAAATTTRAIVRPLAFVVCPIQLSWLACKHESARGHISSSLVSSTHYTR